MYLGAHVISSPVTLGTKRRRRRKCLFITEYWKFMLSFERITKNRSHTHTHTHTILKFHSLQKVLTEKPQRN
jgi:hypothetical protein